MRWPFVFRSTFDAERASAAQRYHDRVHDALGVGDRLLIELAERDAAILAQRDETIASLREETTAANMRVVDAGVVQREISDRCDAALADIVRNARGMAEALDRAHIAEANLEEADKALTIATERGVRAETLFTASVDREAAWERRYDALLTRYQQLRLQGATEPVVYTPAPRREIDPAIAAINARSAGDPVLRSVMMKQLSADRAEQLDETEILRRIEDGVSTEGMPV